MTMRRKRIAVRSGAALTLLLVIAFVICSIKPRREITIIVGGNPNQRLSVRFVADGNVVFVGTNTLPIKQSFEANEFSYWILPDNEMNDSEITLQILVNDVPLWSPNKPNNMGLSTGVKGTVQTGRLFQFGIEISGSGISAKEITAIRHGEYIK